MTAAVNFGGKPNKGTKKDRRLHENDPEVSQVDCPDGDCPEMTVDTAHFGSSDSVSNEPWNGSSGNFTDEQYQMSAAACGEGGTVKQRCVLPHHNPGGALNRSGLGKAAGRVNQIGDAALKARAKAHLRGHYSAIGEKPPPNVAAAIDWHLRSFADTGGPVGPDAQIGPPDARGVLVVEGKKSGDGREFAADSITWPEPGQSPMVLQWQKETSHGGSNDVTVAVGIIDRAWRDGGNIMGEARFDSHPDAVEAKRRMGAGMLRGISILADDITEADVEYVMPEPSDSADDGDFIELLFQRPAKTIYHKGRIRAATLVDTPAYVESVFDLVPEDAGSIAPEPAETVVASERAALTASAALELRFAPDREWFTDPQLKVPTPITITDSGRIYGLATEWAECHLGITGQCILPPRHDDFSHYMTGASDTSDGDQVRVGVVVGGIGHAPKHWSAAQASQYYDNTAAQVAAVAVGNCKLGVWIAGAIVPWASDANVLALKASGQVSPDWRWIGGQLKLVGMLAVNSSGFQVPRIEHYTVEGTVRTLISSGFTSVAGRRSLVASAAVEDDEPVDEQMLALQRVSDMLAALVEGV